MMGILQQISDISYCDVCIENKSERFDERREQGISMQQRQQYLRLLDFDDEVPK
jgi:hypothetical protein